MKKLMVLIFCLLLGQVIFADITITNLKISQLAPWGVGVSYTVNGTLPNESTAYKASVKVVDNVSNTTYTAKTLSGDTDLTLGDHYVIWNAAKDNVSFSSENCTITVTYIPYKYCIIDISKGPDATNYPVSYLDSVPSEGFDNNSYKGGKIALACVEPGSFIMGKDQNNSAHLVTLTRPFYIGIFEFTQKQWTLVTGVNPVPDDETSHGANYPLFNVSYDMIRGSNQGAKWPESADVDESSFIGKIQSRTGRNFDLPTEAQWEYACRAGTTTAYSFGVNSLLAGNDWRDYMWAGESLGKHPCEVGGKTPNPWGLYDMHGNVEELCLDWYGELTYGNDPVGQKTGTTRVLRGGHISSGASGTWNYNIDGKVYHKDYSFESPTSYLRESTTPSGYGSYTKGFRIARVMSRCGSATHTKVSLRVMADCENVASSLKINYCRLGEVGRVSIDGYPIISTDNNGVYTWQPQSLGPHTLTHTVGSESASTTVNVISLAYNVNIMNPPMSKVSAIAITPTTREIAQTGGGAAILTSGSGDWTAAVSDSWITLNSTKGTAGYPVAYTVSVNLDVEDRVGYVYVAGYTHTITQKGLGCTVDKTNIEVERDQVEGTVTITPTDTRSSWNARPNCDWISVSPTSGTGPGTVTYQVAPWYEVSTRSGTITVGGKTITIFQYGSRMKLEEASYKCDYYSHVAPIKVDALAITEWSVTPNASWLSVVDAGNGKGGDTVSIAVAENPSYKERVGTVTIGTETFTITQEGRTALEFSVSPETTTASVSGANGLASVHGTPDLPWDAACDANWITILPAFKSGAGNGNVVYSVSPQSTLYDRTGTITVTPEAKSGLLPKTHKVTQPAATSALSMSGYEFAASGESVAIEVTVNDIVEWKTEESLDWLSVEGSVNRVGPGTVTLMAAANDTIYPREGTIKIAEKNFKVVQKGRGVEIEYDNKLFKTDGGMESISIHPDGNVAWTAVASDPTWIVIYQNDSGTGDAEIMYIIAPYVGDGSPRTGTITVGDKVVYITQRAYDLDITPKGNWVTGNAGEGEIGVSASIGDVWSAIVTEPWITIVTGYDAGTGNGTVRFVYTDNDTGKTRTGKIIVAGEAYTLTQAARIMVPITTQVEGHGGSITGGGSYTSGEKVTLTAVPDSGYEFLYWTGDAGETMQNPIELTADVAKSVTAHFGALSPEFVSTESSTEGVTLTWTSLAWATEYKIYRAPTSEFPTKEIAVVQADGACTFLDTTGEVGTSYFYWVEAIGADDTTESKNAATGMKKAPIVFSAITYTNLMGATHTNPNQYQEGTMVTFTPPSEVDGYTFTGWTPAMITGTMTGPQAVQANWVKKETPPDPPAHTPPTWTQVNKEDTMVVYATVYDKQAKGNIEANGALLGAFDAAGECRGVATIMDGPVGKLFQLSIGVESATEKGLILKVWDPTTGETTEIAERVDCNAEKQLGQIFAPVTFEIGALEMNVAINTGWNWMSIGLVPEDNKIGAVLNGATFANGDIVKSVNATATYYNGLWYPATFTIEPGKAYMVKKTAGGEDTIVVSGANAETTVEVAAGWNWIGSPLMSAQDVNSISHSEGFTNGDMIKSVSKSATYYNGQWYPSDFAIEPGVGYKAKVAKGGTLTFTELTSKARKAAASFLSAPSSKFSAPIFKPVAQEDTMVVYATVRDSNGNLIETDGSLLAAFTAEGECRGVTEIMEGPLGKLYQLSIGVASATEKGFVLKVWDAATGELSELAETIDANEEKQIGQIFAPVGYSVAKGSSDPSDIGEPPTFKPVAQEDTMVVYATIVDGSGAAIETDGSILVAFAADGECRGVTEIMAGPLGKLYQLSVGVASATEKGFALKVWNAANGKLLEVEESIDSNTDKQIGQIFAPVTYHAKSASVVEPSVEGDGAAEVTGDAENGFVVKPSEGTTEVVITIPEGVDADKVTIVVSTAVQSVKANGATITVVKGEVDITEFLAIPAAVDGVVNIGAAEVKEEIVKETLDTEKGAVVELSAEEPTLTTTATKPGLTYTLVEGATLESMADGDSKLGDGTKWTPDIKVKGGNSGFYTIKVTK